MLANFYPVETRVTLLGMSLFSFRMFGLFLILPVIAVLGQQYQGANTAWLGMAVGVYGICQGSLQIPFGWLSDKYGRRYLLLIGISLFIVGSVVAAISTHIIGLLIGRALQGAGAIGAVILAMLSDHVREKNRPLSMMCIGLSIASTFLLAIILGPKLSYLIGLKGVFWLMAALGVLGFLFVLVAYPNTLFSGSANFSNASNFPKKDSLKTSYK